MKELIANIITAVGIFGAFFSTAVVFAAMKVGSDEDRRAFMGAEEYEEITENVRTGSHPRKFYSIEEQDDGTVDVYLCPDAVIYNTDLGIKEYDIDLRVVRGIVYWDGLEEDIRARYSAWCESADPVNI